MPISAADVAMVPGVGVGGVATLSGAPTANSTVISATNGFSSVALRLSGVWVGSIGFWRSKDGGTTYMAAAPLAPVVGNGDVALDLVGFTHYMVRASAWTSGAATIDAVGSAREDGSAAKLLDAGLSDHKLVSAATTNATSVKATGANLKTGRLSNTNAAWRYFKLYNKAIAPVVGTDIPVVTLGLAPNSSVSLTDVFGSGGKSFLTGLAYAITGAAADADATAIGAGDVLVQLGYY